MRTLHGRFARIEESVPLGTTASRGRFGRLFGALRPLDVPDAALEELGKALVEREDQSGSAALDNSTVPAGFTYLGQFIDHDITFDPTPLPEKTIDPQAIFNFRTPRLDLDSLYGLGPAVQPYLYDRADRALLALGDNAKVTGFPDLKNDLPRSQDGFALIGDPRNDENLIVAQLHVAFLKFHNAVARQLQGSESARFEAARRTVTWHYQWIVLHEFLDKLLAPGSVTPTSTRAYRLDVEPYIPVEFSVAAYRFGHTMVRNDYSHNHVFGPGPGQIPATLKLLFHFTGPKKEGAGGAPVSVPVPANWAIDWRRFFDLGSGPDVPRNASRRLDPLLALELHKLAENRKVDGGSSSLAVRNLLRGQRVSLPSGQSVAAALSLPALNAEQIGDDSPDGKIARQHGLIEQTPLWYYILKEAHALQDGKRLGAVGSAIVADVFVALLRGDPTSYLAQDPLWKPTLERRDSITFTMADLLRFADKDSPTINAAQPGGNA